VFSRSSIELKPAARHRRAGHACLLLSLLAAVGCSDPPSDQGGPLQILDARIRALAPGQDKTAAYFDVHNAGAADVTLVGAETAVARAVEIHQIIRDGDMVRMRRQSEVVIPAGETVRFAPGGLHLMLFGVSSAVDGAEIVLITSNAERVDARFREMALGAQQ
jgi:copper(I)-binding protein